MGRLLTTLLLCIQLSFNGIAQQPQPTPPPPPPQQIPAQPPERKEDLDVVKITTNLVQIDAVVIDKKGQQVTDLKPDEVEMLEDGRPQKITNFSYINLDRKLERALKTPADKSAPLPPVKLQPEDVGRAMALVVDDLGLSFESTYYVRRALKKFLDEQMRPNDLVAIIRSGGGVGALQQFTSDKRQLYAAIEKIKWTPWGRSNIATFAPITTTTAPPSLAGNPSTRTAGEFGMGADRDLDEFREDLFAVGTMGALGYVVNGLKKLPGRKSIVLFSEGFTIHKAGNPASTVRVASALRHLTDLANRAAVVINTVDVRGLQTLGLTAADATGDFSGAQVELLLAERRKAFIETQGGLDDLAQRTGGISVKNSNDLAGGLKKIIGDNGYYLIGYRPDDSTFERINGYPKFHNISLKVKRPGEYKVRMRSGFYGLGEDEAPPTAQQTPQQQLFGALMSPFTASGIRLRLTSLFINKDKLGSAMHSILHVDARDLVFNKEADGTHKAVFDIAAVIFGDNGIPVERFNYVHTIRIREQNFARLMSNGFTYTMTVPIKKVGAYQLRAALRDQTSSQVGSASQFIEVPDIKKNKLLISGILLRAVSMESYMKGLGLKADEQNVNDIEPDPVPYASAAIRQFKTGMALVYGFTIYNAQFDKAIGKPRLSTRVRVFRNGEQLFAGDEVPLDISDQTDLKRIATGGGIQLGTSMTPGEYVLQIIVTDLAKEKPRVSTQWMDFEIVQ